MLRTNVLATSRRIEQTRGHKNKPQSNILDLIFCIFVISGVLVGVMLLATVDENYKQELISIVGGYVNNRSSQSFLATFLSAISINLLLVMVLLFCGYCSISLPLICSIAAFKGLGYGVSTAMVYSIYGADAFLYVNLLMLPNALLSSFVIINSCKEATKSSMGKLDNTTHKSREQIGDYNLKIMRNLVLILLSGVLEALLFVFFGSFFIL